MPNYNTPGFVPATIRAALDILTSDARLAANGVSADACVCIVDGSRYGPSWRAIRPLDEIWEIPDTGETYDHIDMVNDALDQWEANVSLPRECTVGWDEGCLYVYGPDFDHDAF